MSEYTLSLSEKAGKHFNKCNFCGGNMKPIIDSTRLNKAPVSICENCGTTVTIDTWINGKKTLLWNLPRNEDR